MSPARFVPTRAGIVNLYEYADETFKFADGRLLLRGHNTSGKTKVLELLFPFCLDGDISPARLDPFAGTAKEMKWNLVGCIEQDTRVGYVWIEFERVDQRGGIERVTAGIGMKAWRDRPGVTRWFWVLAGPRVSLVLMAVPQTVPVRRLSFEDVMAMVEAGILRETDRIELEGGVLVEMEPSGGPHSSRVTWLTMHFARSLDEGFVVRVQDTFLIPDGGFYEPDLVIGRSTGEELPRSADLVVEVAVSSRRRDREKAAVYAASGVTEYWIVDVEHGEVVVHREPESTGYRSSLAHGRGERIAPPVPAAEVDVTALLHGA